MVNKEDEKGDSDGIFSTYIGGLLSKTGRLLRS
jgi:hypothetical protein